MEEKEAAKIQALEKELAITKARLLFLVHNHFHVFKFQGKFTVETYTSHLITKPYPTWEQAVDAAMDRLKKQKSRKIGKP